MATWHRGDIVEIDGLLAVVVGVEGDPYVPTKHIAVWFGEPRCRRKSEGGPGGQSPVVWTVPAECFIPAAEANYQH
jgi:hypothetical protein